jgi:hypothetical protein
VIEIGFGEAEGFLDAEPGAPEDHDQAAQAASVGAVASGAHDGDDALSVRAHLQRSVVTADPMPASSKRHSAIVSPATPAACRAKRSPKSHE